MNQADLLIVFGASFSHHTGIDQTKPIIQVDFDRMALGKFHGVDEAVWGDVGTTARLMREQLARDRPSGDQPTQLAERWRLWREDKQGRERQDRGHGINSAIIFPTMPSSASTSGTTPTRSAGTSSAVEQTVIMSGYLGSIGFGFPAAMGAWAAAPDRTVVAISGDGGFGQYMGDFLTAVKYGMNITHVLLNNG